MQDCYTNSFNEHIPIVASHIRSMKVSQSFNFSAIQVLNICVH